MPVRRTSLPLCVLTLFACLLLAVPLPAQKKVEEEKPQVLALAPEAPDFVKAETARYSYLPLPVEDNGLLSRQVEESMKNLRRLLKKRKVLRITAWVGGAGDARRVSSNIRELLAKWRMPIPAISVIRVGALPNRASRVAFDIEIEEEDPVNPHGLLFLAGVRTVAPEFRFDIKQEFDQSIRTLEERLREEGATPADALHVRCFVSVTEDMQPLELALRQRFPNATPRVLQSLRSSPESYANCNLIARLGKAPVQPLEARVITPRENEPPITSLLKTNARTLVISSAQLGFRATDADLALAFERLQHTLAAAGTTLANAAQLSILAASLDVGRRTEAQGRKYLNSRYDPAILRVTVEGLPALDATVSLDTIAVIP
jgi:enamine deaminase RidA (YjgF/YER057c/UK114 family)